MIRSHDQPGCARAHIQPAVPRAPQFGIKSNYRIYSNSIVALYIAAATINFAPSSVRLLIEGGYYLFRARAMIDTAARMRYVYIRTYAGQRPPDEFIARAATIRGRLILLGKRYVRLLFEGGYYSMCGYYSNKYGMYN